MPQRRSARLTAFALILPLAGCHPKPPAIPAHEVQQRSAAEADITSSHARLAQAERAVEQATVAVQLAADAAHLADATADRTRRTHADYQATLAEVRDHTPRCTLPVDRLLAAHTYLAQFTAEPQRDAAIASLERCRRPALALHKRTTAAPPPPALTTAWLPAKPGPRPTPTQGVPDPGPARDELTAATERQHAAQAVATQTEQHLAATSRSLEQLNIAQAARADAWNTRIERSSHRLIIVGGVVTFTALIPAGFAIYYRGRHARIEHGAEVAPSGSARAVLLEQTRRAAIASLGVSIAVAAVGLTLVLVGVRRPTASRVALAPDGFSIRF